MLLRFIAVFQTNISQSFLVKINGYRFKITRSRWLLTKLDQMVSLAESEIAFLKNVLLLAVVHAERARQLITKNMLWYELFTLPTSGVVTGVQYLPRSIVTL